MACFGLGGFCCCFVCVFGLFGFLLLVGWGLLFFVLFSLGIFLRGGRGLVGGGGGVVRLCVGVLILQYHDDFLKSWLVTFHERPITC